MLREEDGPVISVELVELNSAMRVFKFHLKLGNRVFTFNGNAGNFEET